MEALITQEIELFLGFGTFLVTTFLGFLVYFQNPKSWTNRLFLLLALLIDNYIWINYLSLHPPQGTAENQLYWIRLVMFITSLIGPAVFLFVHTFPKQHVTLKKKYRIGLFLLMAASAIASLTTLVFKDIHYPGGEPIPIPGPGIPLFMIDFVGLFIFSVLLLIYRYRRAKGLEKKQLKHLLFGVAASFLLMGITTVVFVVVLETSAAVFLGPIYPVILMLFIAYAIMKHKMFNAKVLATQLVMGIILIAVFTRLLFSQSLTSVIIDGSVLIVLLVFGYFLIQSVRTEIAQRERVQKLATSLERANERLKELDELKTEFLSIASHQLRTPLSIIKGYSELLEDGAYGKTTKKMQEVLHNIDQSNEQLIKLVDEFLNISRIEQERTQYTFAKTDMSVLTNAVVTELKAKASTKGITLKKDMHANVPEIVADADKVRHGVYNFVDNAIKYSPADTTITITVRKERQGVCVEVVDKGVGMSKKDIKNLFQKFYRSPDVMRDFQGTGLGLYVVRKFIEAHGGRVWANSPGRGKGSTFGLFLPGQPPASIRAQHKQT